MGGKKRNGGGRNVRCGGEDNDGHKRRRNIANTEQGNRRTDHTKDSSALSQGDSRSAVSGKDLKSTRSIQRGKVTDTLIKERAFLSEDVKPGLGLGNQDFPRNFGLYHSPWNARSYAHKMSTNLSR